MERPKHIMEWAKNVRQLPIADDTYYVWIWEFSGGEHVFVGYFHKDGTLAQEFSLDCWVLGPLVEEFVKHADRYRAASQNGIINARAYSDYNNGLLYEEDYP